MANESATIVQRLWNYCNVLRDDGVSYGDYVEQLTYLLFLKMADEQTQAPYNKPSSIPQGLDWQSLIEKDGDALEIHYRHILESLGKEKGMLGVIFRKSQNKIQDPAKLKRLIELINDETWVGLDIDIKGDIYEGLLQKNAEDVKGGAGQYFTPRSLIKAMVEVVRPEPEQTICDPGGGKENPVALDQLAAIQHLMDIQAGRLGCGQFRFTLWCQPCQHRAAQGLDRASGDDALGDAADTHQQVDTAAGIGRHQRAGDVAVGAQQHTRAGHANLLDQILMPRPVEYEHDQVSHRLIFESCHQRQGPSGRRVHTLRHHGLGRAAIDDNLIHIDRRHHRQHRKDIADDRQRKGRHARLQEEADRRPDQIDRKLR